MSVPEALNFEFLTGRGAETVGCERIARSVKQGAGADGKVSWLEL